MNNRQRFEKWVSDTYGYSVQRYNDGPMEYMRQEVERLWTAWQAAHTATADGSSEPVAWTVVDPDGNSSIGGWQDMSTHSFWKETVVLREGHDFAYAYAGGVTAAPPRVTVRVEGIGAVTLDVVDGGIDLPADTIKGLAAQLGVHAAPVPKINIECETTDGNITGTCSLPVIRVESEDDGSYTAVTNYWPAGELLVLAKDAPVQSNAAPIAAGPWTNPAPVSADSSEAKLNCAVCAGSGHIADAMSNPYLLIIAELAECIKRHTKGSFFNASASDIHSIACAIAETVKRLQALSNEGVE